MLRSTSLTNSSTTIDITIGGPPCSGRGHFCGYGATAPAPHPMIGRRRHGRTSGSSVDVLAVSSATAEPACPSGQWASLRQE
jgi:hypothetical protein